MQRDLAIRLAMPADISAVVALSDGLFQEDSGTRDPLMNHDWAKTHGLRYFGGLLENNGADQQGGQLTGGPARSLLKLRQGRRGTACQLGERLA